MNLLNLLDSPAPVVIELDRFIAKAELFVHGRIAYGVDYHEPTFTVVLPSKIARRADETGIFPDEILLDTGAGTFVARVLDFDPYACQAWVELI